MPAERRFRFLRSVQRWPRLDGRHHRYVLRRFPFNVVYRYNETEIIVVAVSHQRRYPDDWRGR